MRFKGIRCHAPFYSNTKASFAISQERLAKLRLLLTTLVGCLFVGGIAIPGDLPAQDFTGGYRLGRGYEIGKTGIRLGGYASTHIEGLGEIPWSFDVSDLSLFISWDNGSRLRFFSELEVEDAVSAGEHQGLTTSAARFRLERLYLDYLVNENLTVRVGKFLTPVGQWNLIHADPLVWTTNRPVATDNLFSQHATGIMLHGNVPIGNNHSLDYSAYADYSSALDPNFTDDLTFDNAIGLRLRYNLNDQLKIGLSYVDYALVGSHSSRNHLVGLDLAWSYRRYAINSEIVYRNTGSGINSNAWQGYVQAVNPIAGNFYGIGRYEFFEQAHAKFGQAGVVGIAYRPIPPLVWKLEYQFGRNNRTLAPDGLFASFAVLF